MNNIQSKLGIVILNYNSHQETQKCVDNLLSFKLHFQIIIIDNNSSDQSWEILNNKYSKILNVHLLLSQYNNGYNAGNNIGIKYALDQLNVDVICIMNPDILVNELTMTKMYRCLLQKNEYGLIGGVPITNMKYSPFDCAWQIPNGLGLIKHVSIFFNKKRKAPSFNYINNNLIQVDCVAGCFFMIKGSILKKYGYFDENVFLYNEEILLGYILKNNNIKEIVLLDAIYFHNHNYKDNKKTFKQKAKGRISLYKSTIYLCKKYYSRIYLPFIFLVSVFDIIYIFIVSIKNSLFLGKESNNVN